ncbi:MAG: hypothetical protein RIT43_933 [Bacteroidota bacterium]|jgi:K+-sensing histidine kinase KdpD
MKRQTVLIFYLLGVYVILQFGWWGYHLIELTEELKKAPSETAKRTAMVLGEGLVFFGILLLGLWKIRSSIRKELQLARNQNNFLLSVTHELKTPLAASRLYLQTLQKHGLQEEKRGEILDKALESNHRLEALIDNILNATRLEHNALTPTKSDLTPSLLIDQVLHSFKKQYPKAKLEVEVAENLVVSSDKFFLESILTNLIDNAIKYAGEEALIHISARKDLHSFTFEISDNGPGIPDTEKKAVFHKFYRSGLEETRSQKGSGLGLFIVAELVRLLGGTIELSRSTYGGAKFLVILPL